MSQTTDPFLYKKITRLYVLALSAVAILTIGGQLLVQRSLNSQLSDSRVINVAGRQRMLSQKLSKTVLLLNHTKDASKTSAYLAELDEALVLWEKCHLGLKTGNMAPLQTSVHNSPTIQRNFQAIDPYFASVYTNARLVSNTLHANTSPDKSKVLETSLAALLEAEPHYLRGMDHIVSLYDQEAAQRVHQSRQLEQLLLWVTLAILALEAFFVFRPAVGQIKATISQLVQSEQQTQRVNQELVLAHQSLLETKEALLEATTQKYEQEISAQKLRSSSLLEGQEEERKRVSKEIHDGLGQMLTALKFGIEKVGDSVDPSEKAQKDLSALRELVSQTIAEARSISFDLMPAVLNDFGVASALRLLTSQLASSTGKNISFSTNLQNQRLPKNVEIGLYRIAQEALHNALKYARAEEITLGLSAKKKYIHLNVSDNGRGFEYVSLRLEAEKQTSSQGISNMKERVYLLDGKIDITSVPGNGTQIHVKIPHPIPPHEQD